MGPKRITTFIILCFFCVSYSAGFSVSKVQVQSEDTVAKDLPVTVRDVISKDDDLNALSITEAYNDVENEISREERDVAETESQNAAAVTDKDVIFKDEAEEQVTESGNWAAVEDDSGLPPFVRPVFPNSTTDEEVTTINPIPPDFDVDNLPGINITDDTVLGRASCRCGVPNSKIVGGTTATIRELPWTAALLRGSGGRPYCGGTLINNKYVVTASHCVYGMSASGISVLLNEQDFNSPSESKPQRYGVAQIIKHENYNPNTIDYDIALLRLSSAVPLEGSTVVPVCLPSSNKNDFTDQQATVAGWGTTSAGGQVSPHLRKVIVPVISNQDCNGKTKYRGKITDRMMCAGYVNAGGKDSCQGDSGGPLIIENGGRKTLIGVVSWGYGCAQAQAPGVYARVGKFPDWILKNTAGADWCQG